MLPPLTQENYESHLEFLSELRGRIAVSLRNTYDDDEDPRADKFTSFVDRYIETEKAWLLFLLDPNYTHKDPKNLAKFKEMAEALWDVYKDVEPYTKKACTWTNLLGMNLRGVRNKTLEILTGMSYKDLVDTVDKLVQAHDVTHWRIKNIS